MKFLAFFVLSFSLCASNFVLNSARLSQAIYEKHLPVEFQLISKHEHKIFGNKLMAFQDPQTDSIYIVIRGTAQLSNWLSNAHIAHNMLDKLAKRFLSPNYEEYYNFLRRTNQDWFINAFQNLKQASDQVIQKYPEAKFVFTGHSYGGLMANLLAQAAYIENPNLDFECHTFNAPGAQEIRKYSLAMPEITETVLKEHIWNHVRFLDP